MAEKSVCIAHRRAELVHDFRRLFETKQNELEAAKLDNPRVYEELTKFKSAYDDKRAEFEGRLLADHLPKIHTRDQVDGYLAERRNGWEHFLNVYDHTVTHELRNVIKR